jgi:hypothetical protein|tara:strand:- start:31345 stop:31542 length:198 start_codon:yes stop_codon:yes gene_type:complete
MFSASNFREWLSAAATGMSFYTGLTTWHEMPARQADLITKFSKDANLAADPVQLEFADAFKAAAD